MPNHTDNNEIQPQRPTKGLPGAESPVGVASKSVPVNETPSQSNTLITPKATPENRLAQFHHTGGTPTLADIKGFSPGIPLPKSGPLVKFGN